MTKRILSAILALCLLLSVIPMASAQGTGMTNTAKIETFAEDIPTLALVSGKNPAQLASGSKYTMTYKRDDKGYYLTDVLVIFQADLTGITTQAGLNGLAAFMIDADADAEYVCIIDRDPMGSKTLTAQFDSEYLSDGTYLFVVLYGFYAYDNNDELQFYIDSSTAVATPVTVYTPHVHDWELTDSSPVYPRLINTINYYTCKTCGERKTETAHTCYSKAFKDVPSTSNWAHEGIDVCIKNGLMNGVSADRFDPNGTTTRAQFVTILWRKAGSPEPTKSAPFVDVKADSWYAKAAAWAFEKGVVTGTDATHFSPNDPVTRQQTATLLYRYIANVLGRDLSQYLRGDNLDKFSDLKKVDSYALNAMKWANFTHIINGYQDGNVYTLKPTKTATRAEIATIFANYMDWLAR